MRELHKGQLKKIVEAGMSLVSNITYREEIELQDLYKIAEGVKGGPLTKKEKQIIAGYVSKNYPRMKQKAFLIL